MARREIKPPATLAPRECDEELSVEELKQISLFAGLGPKHAPLEELPGTIVLRRYRKGEIICHENDPGFTAFYPLTTKDLLDLRESQQRAARQRGDRQRVQALEEPIATLKAALQTPSGTAEISDLGTVAAIYRDSLLPARPGLWSTLQRAVVKLAGQDNARQRTRLDTLIEGQLFGEMSCLYRTPRSATIVAERECYMLELLRNLLDKMYGNKAFKEQVDALYRARALGPLLHRLPLFARLPEALLKDLRARVELIEYEPGDLICDENDRPDTFYVIRSGYVKVVKNTTFLLGADTIPDWSALCAALAAGGRDTSSPQRKIWDLLAEARAVVDDAADKAKLGPAEKDKIAGALNDLVKQPKLGAAPEFKALVAAAGWEAEAKKLPANPSKWSQHQQIGEFNRRLLAAIFPGVLPPPAAGVARILAYRSVGEPIGEIGLEMNKPRSATCIAYDHSGEGKLIKGRVELVRIDKDLFQDLRAACPALEEEIARVIQQRNEQTQTLLQLPLWEQANVAALSEPFDELGLIQGQKLMLIDLDRCTRCDKCVEACVGSHTQGMWDRLVHGKANKPHLDGRSRLFLDGPRFQMADGARVKNYLVPSTCRQCLDPVCLVGCPVGSIHKGENGQVVIENWCIGCSRCANQCPYGAIQMHATGIISKGARGWRVRRAPEEAWIETEMPFRYDRDWQGKLPALLEIQLRLDFDLRDQDGTATRSFRLVVQSLAARLAVAVNDKTVLSRTPSDAASKPQKDLEVLLGLEAAPPANLVPSDVDRRPVLLAGHNVITVNVAPTANSDDVLLDLGLYAVAKPAVDEGLLGEFSEQLVTDRAVVCDMCSEQLGRQPACVNACPHDAALRVDARAFFPRAEQTRGT